MLLTAAKLRKLGNRSARELWVRGRQETAKFAERLPGGLRGEMSNRRGSEDSILLRDAGLPKRVPLSFSIACGPPAAGRFSAR